MAWKATTKRPAQIARIALDGSLTVEEICQIHDRLCADFADTEDPIDPPGLRSRALLESAVGRQDTGWGSQLKHPTAVANAATLTYGLCNDHPFHNGNKRTALVAMLAHLDRNRLALRDTRQTELFDLMLDIAQSTLSLRGLDARQRRSAARPSPDQEVDGLAEWLCRRTQPVVRGEQEITYRQLGHVLRRFGYDFDSQNGPALDVVKLVEKRRGLIRRETVMERKRIGSIRFPGETKLVGVQKIKQIRRMCYLTEEDGIDSHTFYAGADRLDVFINEYRTVLRRLARR